MLSAACGTAPRWAISIASFARESMRQATLASHRTPSDMRSEEHTSELQSPCNLVCRLLLEKKKNNIEKRIEVVIDVMIQIIDAFIAGDFASLALGRYNALIICHLFLVYQSLTTDAYRQHTH